MILYHLLQTLAGTVQTNGINLNRPPPYCQRRGYYLMETEPLLIFLIGHDWPSKRVHFLVSQMLLRFLVCKIQVLVSAQGPRLRTFHLLSSAYPLHWQRKYLKGVKFAAIPHDHWPLANKCPWREQKFQRTP